MTAPVGVVAVIAVLDLLLSVVLYISHRRHPELRDDRIFR